MEGVATESCAVQSILSSSERPGEKEKEKEKEKEIRKGKRKRQMQSKMTGWPWKYCDGYDNSGMVRKVM